MSLRERFERDGIVFPLPVLTAGEAAHYAGTVASHLTAKKDDIRDLHMRYDWARQLATHPAVAAAAREVAGGEVAVWGTLLLSKPPQSEEYVPWHQDGAYRTFEPDESLSAWIALSDSTAAAGCMRVIAGSHREVRPHREGEDAHSVLRGNRYIEGVAEADAIDVVLRPGEMSIHHLFLVHGSRVNRATHARTGFIVRFLRAGTAWNGPLLRVRGGA